jgi:glycerol dehydrogenase-like iron-containing ADH family enzyme
VVAAVGEPLDEISRVQEETRSHILPHGQPVCLGVYVGSLLHGHRAEEMLETIRRVGVDIRPEAMGITWGDVEHALVKLPEFVREAGLWHGIAHEARITPDFVARIRERVEATFGPWRG